MKASMLANVLALAVTGLTASIPMGNPRDKASRSIRLPLPAPRLKPPHTWHDNERVQKAQEKRAMRASKALKAAGVK